jgi:HTH-type transcriptional regulator, sugar sensing transcriptional regulator
MNLNQDLQRLGLSDKEAKVYLASLELGRDTVQNIAKKAGVNRATTYVILETLSKKGLAARFDQSKKTYFIAANPELLSGIFELQRKEIEERQRFLSSLLPDLKTLANKNSERPTIRFYEDKAGIQTAQEEFLLDQKLEEHEVRNFFPADRILEVFTPQELQGYKKDRSKRKINARSFYNSDQQDLPNVTDSEKIKVPASKYPFTCDISILGDSVRIASLGNKLSAVLIKDKEIAKTLKSIFDLAWDNAKANKK